MEKRIVLLLLFGVTTSCGQLIKISPLSRTVTKAVNDSYVVSCEIVQHNGKGEWYRKNGQKISFLTNSNIRQEFTHSGTDLILSLIGTEDNGSYTCKFPPISVSFTLNVLPPIQYEEGLKEQWATHGTNYRMKCPASKQSYGSWKTNWKINGINAPSILSNKYKIVNEALIVYNVTEEDSNTDYWCQIIQTDIEEDNFKDFSIILHVYSRDPPKVDQDSAFNVDVWGVLGNWANISCSVVARPAASFTWLNERNQLNTSTENSSIMLVVEENSSHLLVLLKNENDFGEYICEAKNVYGSVKQKFFLRKARAPPKPFITPEVISATQVHFKITYRNVSDFPSDSDEEKIHGRTLPINGRNVEFKMNASNLTEWTTVAPKYSFDYNEGFVLTGLEPNTSYWVRSALKNEAGLGEYSQAVKVTTDRERSNNTEGMHNITHQQNCADEDLESNCDRSYKNELYGDDLFGVGNSRSLETPLSLSLPMMTNESNSGGQVKRSKMTIHTTESVSSHGVLITVKETIIEESIQTEEPNASEKTNLTKIISRTVSSINENVLHNGTVVTVSKTVTEETKMASIIS